MLKLLDENSLKTLSARLPEEKIEDLKEIALRYMELEEERTSATVSPLRKAQIQWEMVSVIHKWEELLFRGTSIKDDLWERSRIYFNVQRFEMFLTDLASYNIEEKYLCIKRIKEKYPNELINFLSYFQGSTNNYANN
jgi:hypothetical protein